MLHVKSAGLTPEVASKYSLARALAAVVTNRFENADLERQVSNHLQERFGTRANGLLVPVDLPMFSRAPPMETGTAGEGAELVAIDESVSFTEVLRQNMAITSMGAQVLRGVERGNFGIPKVRPQQPEHLAEGADATLQPATTARALASPKTCAVAVDYERRLAKQSSPSLDLLLAREIASAIAADIDVKAIDGTGGDEPLGIRAAARTGVSEDPWTTPTKAELGEHIANVADVGAYRPGSMGWMLGKTPYRGLLKESDPGESLDAYAARHGVVNMNGNVNNAAAVYGNWASCTFVYWGALDIYIERSGPRNRRELYAMIDYDVVYTTEEHFSRAS